MRSAQAFQRLTKSAQLWALKELRQEAVKSLYGLLHFGHVGVNVIYSVHFRSHGFDTGNVVYQPFPDMGWRPDTAVDGSVRAACHNRVYFRNGFASDLRF